jgi:isopenicillin-N epimerase
MDKATNRRQFLVGTGAAALLPVALKASLADASSEEAYWQLIRSQFTFTEDRVPMNAANLCPSPRAVSERVYELTLDIDRDCSFSNRAKFQGLLESSRANVAALLNASPDEVALVRNTSEANNMVNNGIDLEPGAEIVLWEQNHPTNNVAWDVRAKRFGLRIKRVTTPAKPTDKGQLVELFTSALTPRTKVLALTHVSNVTGVALPIAEIAAVARGRGVHVHVDGAQSWGALDVDLKALGCDTYSASAHKWFMGPKEAGLLYVREDRIPSIWPNVVAPGWGDDVQTDLVGARKFESLGQRDDACLASIAVANELHTTISPSRAEERVRALAQRLKTGVRELGLNLVTPFEAELSGGVCIVAVPPDHSGAISTRLYQEHGIAGASTGGLRLCPHVYNTVAHIDRALAGIKDLLTS